MDKKADLAMDLSRTDILSENMKQYKSFLASIKAAAFNGIVELLDNAEGKTVDICGAGVVKIHTTPTTVYHLKNVRLCGNGVVTFTVAETDSEYSLFNCANTDEMVDVMEAMLVKVTEAGK